MKYIFDFDDVLFYTTRHRKEQIFPLIEKAGIPMDKIEEYYKKARLEQFSLKKILAYFDIKDLHEEIMQGAENFLNTELVDVIKKLGKNNCIIVTYGDEEFQFEKINRAGIMNLFSKIIVMPGSKKETIEKICTENRDEEIIFIDDKQQYFDDLDFTKCLNLKTILYTGQDAKSLFPL